MIAPREDVDFVAERRKMAADLRDVDVLAAAVYAACGGERRRVLADECYAFGHGPSLVVMAQQQCAFQCALLKQTERAILGKSRKTEKRL
jgi:hypothetical protein